MCVPSFSSAAWVRNPGPPTHSGFETQAYKPTLPNSALLGSYASVPVNPINALYLTGSKIPFRNELRVIQYTHKPAHRPLCVTGGLL